MMTERVASGVDVRIRTSRAGWIPILAVGIALAYGVPFAPARLHWPVWPDLFVGGVLVAEALWVRTFGVDLTVDSVVVRGLRLQRIPWQQVQAVLPFDELGSRRVCLVLDSGRRVNLRAPTTMLSWGGARYERDFHSIGQCWLAHRGEPWRPLLPVAPPLPV